MPSPDAASDTSVSRDGIDVSGLDHLPGLDDLLRGPDGCVDPLDLAALVATVDPHRLDDAALLDLARAWDRLTSWTQAGHLRVIAELACVPEDGATGRRPRPVDGDGALVRPHVGDEVGAAVGLTVRGAEHRVWTAIGLQQLPDTRAALASGVLDFPRASAMVDETGGLDDAGRREVEARVLRHGRRDSPGRFRRAVRRAVVRVDAAAARARAERARQDTYVRSGVHADETAWLDAVLTAEDALAVRFVLDAAAQAMRGHGETRTMDQLRATALAAPFWAALATGELATVDGPLMLAVAHGRPAALDLDVHEDEAVGTAVELRGYGPVTNGLAAALAARSVGGPRPLVRVHVHGARSARAASALWPVEPGYRPSTALVRHVVDRDRHCRFPGCTVAARWCDVDHTIAWPSGDTHPGNLSLVCRRHHRLKQRPGVLLGQPEPGLLRWRLPTGHEYETGPPG